MGKKPNPYNKILTILQELHQDYPNQTIGQHLEGALGRVQHLDELWTFPDTEVLFLFERYRMEKENNIASVSEVEQIYHDGLYLDKLFIDEEEDI